MRADVAVVIEMLLTLDIILASPAAFMASLEFSHMPTFSVPRPTCSPIAFIIVSEIRTHRAYLCNQAPPI
jgi:hypothetical protein